MATTDLDSAALKQALKEVLVETLQEHRGMFHEVFAEVLEDFALTEAIREGRQTDTVSREKVFRTLRGER